ncbi:hypothetical protein ACOSQ4_013178 [Xanthoceras sorbifolium]
MESLTQKRSAIHGKSVVRKFDKSIQRTQLRITQSVLAAMSTQTYSTSFSSNEHTDLLNPHHDVLVISLTVANCLIKRILIDNGSSTNGKIVLPVYAEGVNLNIRFRILDCPLSYSIIMGRPWIHEMRAIPSTYHQIIRFPTKWGVHEIRGQQKASRDCYQNTLRTRPFDL